MRQKAANQNAKKNFILYKGHTGWKIKTRLFGTLLVGLSAVAIAESTGTVDVHAATGDAPVVDASSTPAPKMTGSTTLGSSKTDGTTPATTTPAPKEPAATAPTDATPATQSYSPASISAESADISASKVAASATAAAATSTKQYQTLTPDQSMSVGKTDGSGVTLSGSEVQDHFTNTVENFNASGADNYPEKNKTAQAADSNGVWQLTTNGHNFTDKTMPDYTMKNVKGPQVAHVSFENDIDFEHNFTMTGALGIGTATAGADGVGIVFAPGDPEYATTGKSGGNLGVGGLDNAFAFVYDDHHNDGSDDTKVIDPGTGAYFGWRSTDANGVIQKVTDSTAWKAASSFDLSNRATDSLIDFSMSYDSIKKALSVTIQNQTFTRSLADIDTSKGYSISIAASTGQDTNNYSARIDSFTYTPKTALVNVTVADATAGDTPVSTTTPVTANIGDTISVFSTKEAAERAVAADPTLDPSLVTVIPASTTSNVYVVDGDQATASNGTVHYAADDSSIADAAYYSYKVTGDASQAFSVPVAQAFIAEVTPVDSVTGAAIPGMDPIQVNTVAGKSVVIQVPGYTPVTVALNAPAAGETVAQDKVKINTGTTASTDTDVANPITHYYTATGTTVDGKTVSVSASTGTNQSVADALNGQPLENAGSAVASGDKTQITTDDYYWAPVGNAAGTDSTDKSTPKDSGSILVPTQSTLDYWIQQATDNQTKADNEKAAAQDIYDKFVASPDITAEQKTAAKSLLDSVNAVYENLSKTNADAKASLEDAKNSSDPATIVKDSQDGYAGISGMDTSLSEFKKDVDNMSTTNAATQASMVTFKSWSQDYGTTLENPKAIFGDGFSATASADQLADQLTGLFKDPANFYYVDALDLNTHVTPKDVGTYYFKLTDAGRSYIKGLTPDNPNAGYYVSGTVTITPAAAAPTINAATVVYGGNDGKLPEISGSLGTKVAGADDVLTQDDYEVVDTDSKAVVPVDQLQAGGDYTIRYTAKAQADLLADKNYTITDFGTSTLTVTPRDITVTAPKDTKTYGESDPKFELTGVSSGKLVNNDQLSDLGVTLKRDAGEDVKPYAISVDPALELNKNYTITVTPGSLTINKKSVTVTANDVATTYNGEKPATNGFSVPDGALVGNDKPADLGVTLDSISQVNAGTYPKTVTGTAISDNYDVTVTPGTLTIAQAASSVDLGAATMVYGDAFPKFMSTDNVPGTTSTIAQGDFEIVDTTGKVVTAPEAQANGEYTLQLTQVAKNRLNSENPNYAITFGTSTLTVNQRPVSVTAKNTEKTYKQVDPDLELTDTSTDASTGLVAGDDLGVKLTRTSGENVGSYDITMDSSSKLNPNYAVNFTPGTFTINPTDGNVAVTGTTMTYGDSLPSLSVSVNGAPASERSADNFEFVDTTTNSVVTAAKLPAGSYTVQLTQAAQDALSKANGNFKLTFGTGTLTVNKRPITVNINNVTTDYDGSAHGANGFSIAASDKLVDGESSDVLGVTLDPISETEIGTYAITGKADSANYAVTVNSGTLKILGQTDDSKGNKTTTEKDAAGNVVRIDKQWVDGRETIYTYVPDPNGNGKRTVTDKKGDQTLDQHTFTSDSDKATLTDNANTNTIVTLDPTTKLPTFSHETTATNEAGDTTTTTDAEGNVVKVVKTWPNDDNTTSTTTYTYNPGTKVQTVTEEKDGNQVDQKTLVADPTTKITAKATLNSGAAAQTIVNPVEPGKMPTFEHDTTETATVKDITTATTKDDAGNIVKVVKNWPDGTQTIYTLDPSTGKGTVSEQKNGKPVDSQKFSTDSPKVTIADDKTSTIVTYDPTTKLATFEHDTTDTTKDDSGIVTTVTKDDAGNVIKVVKTWPKDNSTTTYTYDPTSSKATITEVNNGKEIDRQEEVSSPSTTTLKSGDGVETIVNTGQPGDMPTFEHDTTETVTDKLGNVTATTKNVAGDIVKVAQQWKDGSETVYTNDNGKRMVSELRNGKPVAQKSLDQQPVDPDNPDATKPSAVTLPDGAGGTVTVKLGQPDAAPTFTHAPASYSAGVSAPATDADKVVKITKKWPDGLQVVYTYDPVSGDRIVSELKNGKLIVQRAIEPDALLAVLPDGKGGSATVKFGKNGVAAPIFTRQLADKAVAARKYAAIYALKKIGFYSDPNFSKATRLHWYTKQRRPNRPQFVVIGYARSKAGTLRYHVRAANGKTGYITANSKFVSNTYYKAQPKTIRVIGKHGVNAYNQMTLNGKGVRHYKRGIKLTVKKIQKHNLTTRLVLSNGTYISGNKTIVIAVK